MKLLRTNNYFSLFSISIIGISIMMKRFFVLFSLSILLLNIQALNAQTFHKNDLKSGELERVKREYQLSTKYHSWLEWGLGSFIQQPQYALGPHSLHLNNCQQRFSNDQCFGYDQHILCTQGLEKSIDGLLASFRLLPVKLAVSFLAKQAALKIDRRMAANREYLQSYHQYLINKKNKNARKYHHNRKFKKELSLIEAILNLNMNS